MSVYSRSRQMASVDTRIGCKNSVTIKTVMENLSFVASLQGFRQVRLKPAGSAKKLSAIHVG